MLYSISNRKIRMKKSKKMGDLNKTKYQVELTDIYRIIHPKAVEYTLVSSGGGSFIGKSQHILKD